MAVTRLRHQLMGHGPQYLIAASCGMSPSRLSEYALGSKPIPVHHLIALSNYLKCPPNDLVGSFDEMEYEEHFAL